MATDYDSPRKTDDDLSEDSLQAEIDQIDAEMAQLLEDIRRFLEGEADGNVDAE